jgi:predicted metal-dependent HD superfamily phosphohydrolase
MAIIAKIVSELWVEACKGIVSSSALADKWWIVLKEHYEEDQRHYHTLEHIHAMCKNWTKHKHQLRAPKEVFFATFFHE